MTNNTKKQHGKGPLPLGVFNAAARGDSGALRAILNHYEGYIRALSIVRLYDDEGRPYLFIDEELRRDLELRLISKVMGFKYRAA